MADEAILTKKEFALFQALMYDHAGIRFSDAKHALVQARLKKRLGELGMASYHEYYKYIKVNEKEFQECLNALTTNETYFFRHKNHWDFLIQTIVPEWKKKVSWGATFRAWSAASSSGEEPYSLAIALRASLSAKDGWKVHVDATDINQEVLNRAERGVYAEYAVQKLTSFCLRKYFIVDDINKSYSVIPQVASLVDFKLHNLLKQTAGPAYDVVFLRNVMIYFDEASKADVVANIARRIKTGGYLFLGGAESLGTGHDFFEYVRPTIYRKR